MTTSWLQIRRSWSPKKETTVLRNSPWRDQTSPGCSDLASPVWCFTDWCRASCVLHLEFLATSASAPNGSWWKWTTSLSSAGAAPRRTLRLGTCSIRYHYIGMFWPLEMVWSSLILYLGGQEDSTSFEHVCLGENCIYTEPVRVNEIHPRILCTHYITELPEEEGTIKS